MIRLFEPASFLQPDLARDWVRPRAGLGQMAPNLKGLFTKPREMMAVKLVSIVGLVISVSASPTTMADVMRDVGVRHVVYGVAPHHLPVRPAPAIAPNNTCIVPKERLGNR